MYSAETRLHPRCVRHERTGVPARWKEIHSACMTGVLRVKSKEDKRYTCNRAGGAPTRTRIAIHKIHAKLFILF